MKKSVLVFTLLSMTTGVSFAGNFSETCESMSMQGSRLMAECRKRDQSSKPTSLNLDKAIGNINGVLSWNSGDFSKSCSNIVLDGATLTATCKKMDGTANQTSLNLDERIDNTNGVLKFDGNKSK